MKEYKFNYKSTLGRKIVIFHWMILYNYVPNILLWLWFCFLIAINVNFDTSIYTGISNPLYIPILQVIVLVFVTTLFWLVIVEIINIILILANFRYLNESGEDVLKEDKIISKTGSKSLEFNYDSITNIRNLGKYIFSRVRHIPGLYLVLYIEDSQHREEVLNFLKSKIVTSNK